MPTIIGSPTSTGGGAPTGKPQRLPVNRLAPPRSARIGAFDARRRRFPPRIDFGWYSTYDIRTFGEGRGVFAKDKWYHDGLKFTCTQCGNCCSGDTGYVWATKEEIRRIAEFLGRPNGRLDKKHLRRVGLHYSLTEKPGGDCVFLTRENGKSGCSIYPVRPLQCRNWPFWNENLRSRESWDSVAQSKCPGMNTGQHYTLVQIETARTKTSW